jgi:hypothetical protein
LIILKIALVNVKPALEIKEINVLAVTINSDSLLLIYVVAEFIFMKKTILAWVISSIIFSCKDCHSSCLSCVGPSRY